MRSLRPHFSRLTIFALLATVLPTLAVESHGASEHLALAGFDDTAVFVSAHQEADRSLHIEPVADVRVARCLGCLLPKKEKSGSNAEPSAATLTLSGNRPTLVPGIGDADRRHSPQAPRAPPVS